MHLTIKLVIYPLIFGISSLFAGGFDYANLYQVITAGLLLSLFLYMTDIALLGRYGNALETTLDFTISVLFIIIYSYLFTGITVSLWSLLLPAVLVAAIEYFTHSWLLRTQKGYYKP